MKKMHPSTPTPIFDAILALSSLRDAGMDCRHPGSQEASGDIHVNLGSSTPCWSDDIEGPLALTESLQHRIFNEEH
jgi:hypothetical protein